MRKGRILFCIFLITVTAYAIFASIGWSFKAKLFPLSISIPLLMLATAQLLLILFGKEETNEGGAMDVEFSTDVEPEIVRRRVLGIFGWIIAFIALVYLLGFPITVPLFIFLYLKFQSEVSWLWTI
ncbi:MAG TPA: tripartite tricarboxylate transporter TctB family protein, partial [Candidatus Saccharimonadales bacterium]|nr:tripartite tricarboxylate transporter TctB family protein [Candidatus Saccharimonadales bacterium]